MAQRTVKMRGTPLPVAGPELSVGDKAPDFKLHQRGPDGLRDVTLDAYTGKTLILSVVPSLDTPVCETQTTKFNEAAAKLPSHVAVLTVSMDLPFAQARFCGEKSIDRVQTASEPSGREFRPGLRDADRAAPAGGPRRLRGRAGRTAEACRVRARGDGAAQLRGRPRRRPVGGLSL